MAFAGFAVFGAFWGAWGASIPAIRDQVGVTEGQLGAALLFVGAGALPAMPLSGRAVDRWGLRATAALLALLGGAGLLVAAARDLVTLALALALLGASSGAADVAINTAAGSAQRASDRPVVTHAHATFAAAVVGASLVTGALHGLDAPAVTPFVVVAGAAAAVATALARAGLDPERREALGAATDRVGAETPGDARAGAAPPRPARPAVPLAPLLVLGGLGALAFAVENAHQSWSALYLEDELGAGPAVAAAGPAVFAAVIAVTRFATASMAARRPAAVMVAGSALAAAGTAIVAGAGGVPAGLAGLALAAAGTAALFPTLMSVLTATVPDERRGAATSVVTTVAYLGFIAGPVYVGTWAGAVGLPGAMLAVAGLAAGLALLAGAALRGIGPPARSRSAGMTGLGARRDARGRRRRRQPLLGPMSFRHGRGQPCHDDDARA
jgi:MFS family permease